MARRFWHSTIAALLSMSSPGWDVPLAYSQPNPELEPSNIFTTLQYETSRYTLICSRSRSGGLGFANANTRQEFVVQEYFRSNRQLPDASADFWPTDIRGVGVRVVIEVYSLEGNLNLGILSSLIGIGTAAEAKRLYGTISIEAIGIGGQTITNVIPVPADLSPKTITDSLQAITSIKTRITEGDFRQRSIYIVPSPISSPRLQGKCAQEGNQANE
ncbi:MAG: hypothetical protein SFW36_01240 [Leptolyngbyaceae cyanobacterium bins.59]|nr:hypothetical protein [Leptolyngbyaceae cyanobacterium bins.59]